MKNTTVRLPSPASPREVQTSPAFWSGRALIFLSVFLITTGVLFFNPGSQIATNEFMVGEPAPRNLFSPFEISLTDTGATEAARQQASRAVFPVYGLDASVGKSVLAKLGTLFDAVAKAQQDKGIYHPIDGLPFEISDSTQRDLINRSGLDDVRKNVNHLLLYYLGRGVFTPEEKNRLGAAGVTNLTVISPDLKKERALRLEDIQTLPEVRASAETILSPDLSRDYGLKNSILEIFGSAIEPNLVANQNEFERRQKKAAEGVEATTVKIKKEELVVQRGMLVTADQKWKIDGIQKKLLERKIWSRLLAIAAMVFLVYALFFMYLFSYDRKTLFSLRKVLLIHSIFLAGIIISKLFAIWPGSTPYLMPTAIVPILLVLLVRARLGILSTAMMAILVSPLSDFAPDVILASLLSGVAATFAAFHVRKRFQFLRLGFAVGVASVSVIFTYHLFRGYSFWESFQISTPGMVNGLLITMPLGFLLLPIFEWLFNIVTDISLLELSDLNHPLLKRMIVEAPGTYHHSLVVSSLAEAACDAIGANGLLARVGAYFHDIGKIHKAQLFTENQTSKFASKHEDLPPQISSQIIKQHVRDGLELGRKYKLKERILQFITEHQGDGIICFFYRKAVDLAGSNETVREEDFRYGGPKPQSKETAVVLLADSVEAASRSVEDPSPAMIGELVRRIIRDKLSDGQLDECDLTLRDIRQIEDVFVHNLMAILHTRMSYPALSEHESESLDPLGKPLPNFARPSDPR